MLSPYQLERRARECFGEPKPVVKKPSKDIPKRSEKMKDELKEYNKIKKEMLAESDRCELRSPVCTGKAQGLQHLKRRGINLLNRKFLKRACNACQLWSEQNPLESIEKGMSLSVHKIVIAEFDKQVNATIVQ